jgi:hypothetical protein
VPTPDRAPAAGEEQLAWTKFEAALWRRKVHEAEKRLAAAQRGVETPVNPGVAPLKPDRGQVTIGVE